MEKEQKQQITTEPSNVLYTLLGNVDFKNKLAELGFKHIGSAWFENENNTIRLRLWTDCEITFWLWRGGDDNEILFRGKIYTIEEVKWVLERCFNVA